MYNGTVLYDEVNFNKKDWIYTYFLGVTNISNYIPDTVLGLNIPLCNSDACLFRSMQKANIISSQSFGLLLDEEWGELTLGGINKSYSLSKGIREYVTSVGSINTLYGWNVSIVTYIYYDNTHQIPDTSIHAFEIDSSYPYIGVPSDVYDSYVKILCSRAACISIGDYVNVVPTNTLSVPDAFSSFALTNTENSYNLTGDDLVILVNNPFYNQTGYMYLAVLMMRPLNNSFVMGIPFLKKYYIYFDYDSREITFIPYAFI